MRRIAARELPFRDAPNPPVRRRRTNGARLVVTVHDCTRGDGPQTAAQDEHTDANDHPLSLTGPLSFLTSAVQEKSRDAGRDQTQHGTSRPSYQKRSRTVVAACAWEQRWSRTDSPQQRVLTQQKIWRRRTTDKIMANDLHKKALGGRAM